MTKLIEIIKSTQMIEPRISSGQHVGNNADMNLIQRMVASRDLSV